MRDSIGRRVPRSNSSTSFAAGNDGFTAAQDCWPAWTSDGVACSTSISGWGLAKRLRRSVRAYLPVDMTSLPRDWLRDMTSVGWVVQGGVRSTSEGEVKLIVDYFSIVW